MKKTDKELLVGLGSRIQTARKDKKLSQSDLAKNTGIDRSYISMVERGEANITFLKLRKIANILEIRVDFK